MRNKGRRKGRGGVEEGSREEVGEGVEGKRRGPEQSGGEMRAEYLKREGHEGEAVEVREFDNVSSCMLYLITNFCKF